MLGRLVLGQRQARGCACSASLSGFVRGSNTTSAAIRLQAPHWRNKGLNNALGAFSGQIELWSTQGSVRAALG
jgi:hypothetical protein